MLIIQAVTVLILVTSVLTSPVNDSQNDHGNITQFTKPVVASSSISDNNSPAILTGSKSANHNDSDTVIKPENAKQFFAEDASSLPKTELPSSPHVPVYSEGGSALSAVNQMPNAQSEVNTKAPSVVARKGASDHKGRITGRKGVNNTQALADTENPEISNVTAENLPVITDHKAEPISAKIQNENNSDHRTEVTGNKISTLVVPGKGTEIKVKHKSKPTVTNGEGPDDGKGMPSSPTQTQLGVPGKVDYIVPVVITIMTTPILSIAAYVLYTRGRDCWDKRHYRRMDFLIDGMYND